MLDHALGATTEGLGLTINTEIIQKDEDDEDEDIFKSAQTSIDDLDVPDQFDGDYSDSMLNITDDFLPVE